MLLSAMGVEHHFNSGDRVLVEQLRIGKLRPKAHPMVFVHYKGALKLTAVVRDPVSGRERDVSAAHLAPA